MLISVYTTVIQRHLAELDMLEGIRLLAADTNRGGTIDVSDATTLQMFIADYQLTYPISEKIRAAY